MVVVLSRSGEYETRKDYGAPERRIVKRDSKVALVVMWLLALIGVLAVMVFLVVFVLDVARGVSSHSLAIATEQCAGVLFVAVAAWQISARRSRQRGASGGASGGKIPARFLVPALSWRRREQAPSSQVRDALPQGAHEGDDAPSSPVEDGPARQQPAYVAPLAPLLSLPEPERPLHVDLSDPERVNRLIAQVHAMPGMNHVTEQITRRVATLQVNAARIADGEPPSAQELHMVFLGPSGVGKTTIARLYAQIFCAIGALPTDKLLEASRADLVGVHVGETALMVRAKVDKAMGGVLFIDEAYALYNAYDQDFGHEATSELVKLMEDRRGHFVVIAAGYRDKMDEWLDSNEGLRPRFSYTMDFPAYDAGTLTAITLSMFESYGQALVEDAVSMLDTYYARAVASPPEGWSNARSARMLVSNIQEAQSVRLVAADQHRERSARRVITAFDVAEALGVPPPVPAAGSPVRSVAQGIRGSPALDASPPPPLDGQRDRPQDQAILPADPAAQEGPSRAYLDTIYEERRQVKAAGATWDREAMRWYDPAPPTSSLRPWVPLSEVLPGEDRSFGEGLFVEPVPGRTWDESAQSYLGEQPWRRLATMVLRRAGNTCEACGQRRGPNQVALHLRWCCEDETMTARLARLMCLCERCEEASHLASSGGPVDGERARRWLARVNNWDAATTTEHVTEASEIRDSRSAQGWRLDLAVLDAATS